MEAARAGPTVGIRRASARKGAPDEPIVASITMQVVAAGVSLAAQREDEERWFCDVNGSASHRTVPIGNRDVVVVVIQMRRSGTRFPIVPEVGVGGTTADGCHDSATVAQSIAADAVATIVGLHLRRHGHGAWDHIHYRDTGTGIPGGICDRKCHVVIPGK